MSKIFLSPIQRNWKIEGLSIILNFNKWKYKDSIQIKSKKKKKHTMSTNKSKRKRSKHALVPVEESLENYYHHACSFNNMMWLII